jgi:hypothetical protein
MRLSGRQFGSDYGRCQSVKRLALVRCSRFRARAERIAVTNGRAAGDPFADRTRRSLSRVVGAAVAADVDGTVDRRRRSHVGRFVVVARENQSTVRARNPLENAVCRRPTARTVLLGVYEFPPTSLFFPSSVLFPRVRLWCCTFLNSVVVEWNDC